VPVAWTGTCQGLRPCEMRTVPWSIVLVVAPFSLIVGVGIGELAARSTGDGASEVRTQADLEWEP
jgi:predicted membrane-bound mannosyltransferase